MSRRYAPPEAFTAAGKKVRDGDGDGLVYDSTPKERPFNPATDLGPIKEKVDKLAKRNGGKMPSPKRPAPLRKARPAPKLGPPKPPTPKARRVRDAAQADGGFIHARVADNRLKSARQGDVLQVKYASPTHARIYVQQKSGKFRAYSVQWNRFEGVSDEEQLSLFDEIDEIPKDLTLLFPDAPGAPSNTPSADTPDTPEGPVDGDVRAAAKAADGPIQAKITDRGLIPLGIKQGDTVDVEYQDDDHAKITATLRSGNRRTYSVSWDRLGQPDAPSADPAPETPADAPDAPEPDVPEAPESSETPAGPTGADLVAEHGAEAVANAALANWRVWSSGGGFADDPLREIPKTSPFYRPSQQILTDVRADPAGYLDRLDPENRDRVVEWLDKLAPEAPTPEPETPSVPESDVPDTPEAPPVPDPGPSDTPEPPDVPEPAPEPEPTPEEPPGPPKKETRAQRAARLAEEHDLDPEEVLRAIRDLPGLKKQARADAAQIREEVLDALDRLDARVMDRPPPLERHEDINGRVTFKRPGGGEWDWFDELSHGEQERLKRNWMRPASDLTQTGSAPDQVGARIIAGRPDVGDTLDEQMQWWLAETRRHDAARSIASGRPPSHVGAIDPRSLTPTLDEQGIDIGAIVAEIGDDSSIVAVAKGRAARIDAETAEQAFRALGSSPNAEKGERPWEMSRESWRSEVEALEYRIDADDADLTNADLDRYDDLAPPDLRDEGSLDDVFDRIRRTARDAGYDVRAEEVAPQEYEGPTPTEEPEPFADALDDVFADAAPAPEPEPAPEPAGPVEALGEMPELGTDEYKQWKTDLQAAVKAERAASDGGSPALADLYELVSEAMAVEAGEPGANAGPLIKQAAEYRRNADRLRETIAKREALAALDAAPPVTRAKALGPVDQMPYERVIADDRLNTALDIRASSMPAAATAGIDAAAEAWESAPERMRIRVPVDVLDQVLTDARIKSQFETGTSAATMNPEYRRVAENKAHGIAPEVTNEMRPVYGFVDDPTSTKETAGYGEIVFRVKPKVAGRTSMSFGDSLYMDGASVPLGTPEVSRRDLVNAMGTFWRRGDPDRTENGYQELQFHGGLSTDDVETEIDFGPMEEEWSTSMDRMSSVLRAHPGAATAVNFLPPAGYVDFATSSLPYPRDLYRRYRAAAQSFANDHPEITVSFPVRDGADGAVEVLTPDSAPVPA